MTSLKNVYKNAPFLVTYERIIKTKGGNTLELAFLIQEKGKAVPYYKWIDKSVSKREIKRKS